MVQYELSASLLGPFASFSLVTSASPDFGLSDQSVSGAGCCCVGLGRCLEEWADDGLSSVASRPEAGLDRWREDGLPGAATVPDAGLSGCPPDS